MWHPAWQRPALAVATNLLGHREDPRTTREPVCAPAKQNMSPVVSWFLDWLLPYSIHSWRILNAVVLIPCKSSQASYQGFRHSAPALSLKCSCPKQHSDGTFGTMCLQPHKPWARSGGLVPMWANYTMAVVGSLACKSVEDAFQVSFVYIVSDPLLPAALSSVSVSPPHGKFFCFVSFCFYFFCLVF